MCRLSVVCVPIVRSEEINDLEEKVMLKDDVNIHPGAPGWRDRYYESKYGQEFLADKEAFKTAMVRSYTEGLCWVLAYYYKGCQSWSWFYPYHYAPCASDLLNLDRFKVEFPPSKPFLPIAQLMGAYAIPFQLCLFCCVVVCLFVCLLRMGIE